MEDALKALLNAIYATPSHPLPPASSTGNERALSPDEFRMYVYKIIPCTRRGPHSWVECSFCHPGEKASRRDPMKFAYAPIACPDMRKDGRCARGDECWFAHSIFEYWLHPARYRTQLCSYGVECKRSICFFAHDPRELRVTEHLAQLQALENALEAQDPTQPAPNAKWPAQNQGAAPSPAKGGQQQQQQRSPRTKAPEAVQAAQLRQLQQAMGAQAPPLSQAMLSALGSFMPGQGGMPHASANAATAALFEAALQPSTPPMAQSLGMAPSLSPCSSMLTTPIASLQTHSDDASVAATMKLLADISAAGHAAIAAPASRLQPSASMPIMQQQQQQAPQQAEGGSDIQQALHLISGLQQLAAKASGGNGDLQSVLMSMLPQVLAQVSGTAQANAAPAPAPAPLAAMPSLQMDVPVAGDAVPRRCSGDAPPATAVQPVFKMPSPRESHAAISPADALSYLSHGTGGSSCSSRLSDGTQSPTLSHHSDDDVRTFGATAYPTLVKDDAKAKLAGSPTRDLLMEQHGPFSLMGAINVDELGGKLGAVGAQRAASAARDALLPLDLEHDAQLACGMAEMSGAAGMIASLSQLVDSPVPSGTVEMDTQLQQLALA